MKGPQGFLFPRRPAVIVYAVPVGVAPAVVAAVFLRDSVRFKFFAANGTYGFPFHRQPMDSLASTRSARRAKQFRARKKDSIHLCLSLIHIYTIVNEDGFYAYNGEERNTYNSLNKDGLWVGGKDDNTGFHVDNDGNVETTGTVEVKSDTNTVTISDSTVTGLTNTTWTPENPGSIVGLSLIHI